LAAEICEYLDTSVDCDYEVEINISNCFEPSFTENIVRSLREESDIKCHKFFANYYTGEFQIIIITESMQGAAI
jgi:hypothetical protein